MSRKNKKIMAVMLQVLQREPAAIVREIALQELKEGDVFKLKRGRRAYLVHENENGFITSESLDGKFFRVMCYEPKQSKIKK